MQNIWTLIHRGFQLLVEHIFHSGSEWLILITNKTKNGEGGEKVKENVKAQER